MELLNGFEKEKGFKVLAIHEESKTMLIERPSYKPQPLEWVTWKYNSEGHREHGHYLYRKEEAWNDFYKRSGLMD